MKTVSMVALLLVSLGALAQSLPDLKETLAEGRARLPPGFLDGLRDPVTQAHPNRQQRETGRSYQILMSEAMPAPDRQRLLVWAATRADVTLVIQGLLPSERTITDAQQRIAQWVMQAEATPNIVLDPRPFERVGTESVPVLLAMEGQRLAAQVAGLTDPNWLEERIQQGQTGDLGQYGTLVKASERNLTEIMKARAGRLDMAALMAQAKANAGQNLTTLTLPRSQQALQRRFVPVMRANQDIRSPQGTLIRRANERVNLLDVLPFHHTLIVFDGSDPKQVQWASERPKQGSVRYLVTGLPDTPQPIKALEQRLAAPVYLLTRGVMTGFNVRRVPSTVQANNALKHFIIEEFVL